MKSVILALCFSIGLVAQTQASKMPAAMGYQPLKEIDMATLLDAPIQVAGTRWGQGFLWNDSKGGPDKSMHSVVFETQVLHPRQTEQKLAAWFGLDCSKSYRWGCKINPR